MFIFPSLESSESAFLFETRLKRKMFVFKLKNCLCDITREENARAEKKPIRFVFSSRDAMQSKRARLLKFVPSLFNQVYGLRG